MSSLADSSSGHTHPQWLLKPLPLSQVSPDAEEPVGTSSLVSLCLASLSHSFHLLSAADMTVLPPHLATKLFTRLASDRGYDLRDNRDPRPDAATMWAFSALADPAKARSMPTWTLQLPQAALLQQLGGFDRVDEKLHPLVALPQHFARLRPDTRFLTTLRLKDLDDAGLKSLKHLPALAVLDTPAGKFADDGVRLLAAATSVPERRGAWGLRAWFMTDCARVTDRSMRALVRFGGLSLLDLRGTGCSPAAVGSFNRANVAWDGGTEFLPVTPGLRGLFAIDELDGVLEKLCMTLLAPDVAPSTELPDGERSYLSLHVEPAAHQLETAWLHLPPRHKVSQARAAWNGNKAFNAAHGQLWGTGVARIEDEAADRRRRVKTALEMQAEDEYAQYCAANGLPIPKSRQEKAYDAVVKERKAEKAYEKRWMAGRVAGSAKMSQSTMGAGSWRNRGNIGAVVPLSEREMETQRELEMEAASADERSRRFAAVAAADAAEKKARRSKALSQKQQEKSMQGDKNLMLVRMLPQDWRELRWIPAQKEAAPASQDVGIKRRADAGEAVYDLLASAGIVLDEDEPPSSDFSQPPLSSQPPASSSPVPTPRAPKTHPFFKPPPQSSSPAPPSSQTKRSSNPFAKPSSSQASQSSQVGFNPFKAKGRAEVNSQGVKKLAPVLGEKRRLEPSQTPGAKRNVFRKL